jgi:predicted transcriptional regulator YdeE
MIKRSINKSIEQQIKELIKELHLEPELSLKGVKYIIWNEVEGNKEFQYLIGIFVKKAPNFERANEIAQIVSEAWNTLPHKSLGGLSPAEVLQRKNK